MQFSDFCTKHSPMSNNQEEPLFSETTEKETDKKCPNCGATVVFNPKTGMMHCEYCGYSCELPSAETEKEICEMDFESAIHTESFNWGEQKKEVQCKQCGAISIYDALETAAVCPFCGSTSVMPAATENTISPGAVCPFSITKEQAGLYFLKWLKGIPRRVSPLLDLRRTNHLQLYGSSWLHQTREKQRRQNTNRNHLEECERHFPEVFRRCDHYGLEATGRLGREGM